MVLVTVLEVDLKGNDELHVAAVLAAVNEALSDGRKAFDLDDLERTAPRPEEYVEVAVSRRAGGNLRAGATSTSGWRIELRGVAHVRATNARNMLAESRTRLEFQTLLIDGKRTTPIQFESASGVGKDDGWWSGDLVLTYTV